MKWSLSLPLLFSLLAVRANAMPMTLSAQYTVPVDSSLSEYSTLEVNNYRAFHENGRTYMSFLLPADLVGQDQKEVVFQLLDDKQAGAFQRWASSQGEMRCSGSWEHKACLVKFKNISMSIKSVQEFLRLKYATGVAEREFVAAAFHSEPIGFILLQKN